MNSDEKSNLYPLMRRPSSAIEKAAPGAKRILADMVAEALALARNTGISHVDLDALVREGKKLYNPEEWTDKNLQASEFFFRAAEAGDGEAQFLAFKCSQHFQSVLASVGECGLQIDKAVPIEWLQKSAESGFAEAQYVLGCWYEDGESVPQNYTEAARWYRKAAQQNHAEAQFTLGICYENGQGVAVDEVEAVKWYSKAAEQDHAGAQYQLGDCCRRGQGVPQNLVEAVRWYRKAAEQGDADAQYRLGMCYQYGQGVVKDEAEAEKWQNKAREKWRDYTPLHLSLMEQDRFALAKRFRLGEYEWCEPDYRQILAWSNETRKPPEFIIQRLVERKSSFADGRLIEVHWDVDSMFVKKFGFVPGLKIKVFSAEWSEVVVFNNLNRNLKLSDFRFSEINLEGLTELEVLAVPSQNLGSLNLRSVPKLKQIICESNELSSLDLSGFQRLEEVRVRNNLLSELDLSNLPVLKSLDCRQNRLSFLDLSGAPALEFLDCRENLRAVDSYDRVEPKDVLDITPLKNLKVLKYDADKTRLIQRPDQHF